MKLRTALLAGAVLCALGAPPVLAAQPDAGGPPATYSTANGTKLLSTPTQVVGIDSITGAACLIGSSPTCQLPGTGGSSNASVGTNGATGPTNSTQVGAWDGSGNLQAVSPAHPMPTTAGGYEFQASAIPTVQNATYAAGQSLGGLQTISIGSTNGLSGILKQVQLASKGGSTVAVVFYVWSKNPTGTTCTDKANFVASQTDNQFLVIGPTSITPALALSAQDTMTYGAASNLVGNFVNGSNNTNLYVCAVAAASVTPATTTDLRYNVQGIKDAP